MADNPEIEKRITRNIERRYWTTKPVSEYFKALLSQRELDTTLGKRYNIMEVLK